MVAIVQQTQVCKITDVEQQNRCAVVARVVQQAQMCSINKCTVEQQVCNTYLDKCWRDTRTRRDDSFHAFVVTHEVAD